MRRQHLVTFVALALVACTPAVEESLTTTVAADDSATTGPSSATVTMTDASLSVSDDDGGSVGTGTTDGAEVTEDSAASESAASSDEGEDTSDGGSGDSGEAEGKGSDEHGTTAAESTGVPPIECEPLDEDACNGAGDDCMTLVGRPFVHENGPWWCTGDEEFAGCASATGCDDAQTVACDGDDNVWLFSSSCLPSGWVACDPPGNGDFDSCA